MGDALVNCTLHVRAVTWWYWFLAFGAMVVGFSGRMEGYYVVLAISTVAAFHCVIADGLTALQTQVRLVYLTLAGIALLDPTHIVWSVVLLGTVMVTFFDRCVIARVLRRMPWNRNETVG
jgi:hypothetical protein